MSDKWYGTPEYGRAWRDKHKDRLAFERKQKYHTEWKPRLRRRNYWINKYKVSNGCLHCGYNLSPYALDFDHIDPIIKKFNVSQRLCNGTLRSLFREIRKCQILCANCHRIKTYKDKCVDV